MNLPQPKNSTQEVLLYLLKYGKVSIMDFSYLSGFRTRISDLKNKYGLNIQTEMQTAKNKFNRTYNYAEHYLPETEKNKAANIYLNIGGAV